LHDFSEVIVGSLFSFLRSSAFICVQFIFNSSFPESEPGSCLPGL
jgi:hypothetical protein